jgi:hypothetical protein
VRNPESAGEDREQSPIVTALTSFVLIFGTQ